MAIKLITVGDSNTANASYAPGTNDEWPYLLDTALEAAYPAQDFTLVNSGRGGWSVRTFLDGLGGDDIDTLCLNQDPHIVPLMLGTNDTYGSGGVYNSDESAAIAAYVSNMSELIERILAHKNADGTTPKIVLMQPPIAMNAVYGTRDGYTGFISSPYTAGNPYQYGRPTSRLIGVKNAVSTLGASYDLPVVTTWDNLNALGWDGSTNTSNTNIYDGVHLSANGHTLVSGYVKTAVDSLLDTNGNILTTYDLDVRLLSQYDLDVILEEIAQTSGTPFNFVQSGGVTIWR